VTNDSVCSVCRFRAPLRNQYRSGQAPTYSKVCHFTGVDPEAGVYTYEDVNDDGQLSSNEDKQTIKDFSPKVHGGLQILF
jgi:hypothetical protein